MYCGRSARHRTRTGPTFLARRSFTRFKLGFSQSAELEPRQFVGACNLVANDRARSGSEHRCRPSRLPSWTTIGLARTSLSPGAVAPRSGVGKTSFAHAAVFRDSPSGRPQCAGSAQGDREHATGTSMRPALATRSNPASSRAAAPPPAVPVSDHKQPRRRGSDARARTKGSLDRRVAAHLLFATSWHSDEDSRAAAGTQTECSGRGSDFDVVAIDAGARMVASAQSPARPGPEGRLPLGQELDKHGPVAGSVLLRTIFDSDVERRDETPAFLGGCRPKVGPAGVGRCWWQRCWWRVRPERRCDRSGGRFRPPRSRSGDGEAW